MTKEFRATNEDGSFAPVQTRDGKKARIVCMDYKGSRPGLILALVDTGSPGINEHPFSYLEDGRWDVNHKTDEIDGLDLVNVPDGMTFENCVVAED